MTRIAVFCDGTWNSKEIETPTSIVRLQHELANNPAKGQVAVYFKGIGTNDKLDGPVKRVFNKFGGGAFGWGLGNKVKQAYQFIAKVYQPGDEIYLFGFSRGAYTARSVAGMIRKCGIARDTSGDGINRAYALYRKRGRRNHPDEPHILKARRAISPKFATSDWDLKWRGEDGSELVNIAYLGVFDTVGAKGIPVAALGPVAALWNRKYRFHDAQLSSLVKAARHAVAVDEQRKFFAPTMWDNVKGVKGLNKRPDEDPERPYQQIWFVGNHGIVGGSGDAPGLSAITADWIMDGAKHLTRKPAGDRPDISPDPLADSDGLKHEKGLFKGWRKWAFEDVDVHPSVRNRVAKRSEYRPGSLAALLPGWTGA